MNVLMVEKPNFEKEFEPFLETLDVEIELNIATSLKKKVFEPLIEKDGIHKLKVSFERYWKKPGKLTSLPSPSEVYNSIISSLENTLKTFGESEKKSEDDLEDETLNEN